jgi:hypothetical protein
LGPALAFPIIAMLAMVATVVALAVPQECHPP